MEWQNAPRHAQREPLLTQLDRKGKAGYSVRVEASGARSLAIAMPPWFHRYVMPGLVFESVVVGGGYATGRELVEFFLSRGPVTGLLGMIVTLGTWGIVLAITFEFARLTRSFDYQTFFGRLLGRGSILFEMAFLCLMLLVLSVLGAGAAALFDKSFGLPRIAGSLSLMMLICVIVYFGSNVVERVLSLWAVLLYCMYASLLAWCLSHYATNIAVDLTEPQLVSGWLTAGIIYAGYNLAAAPSTLFCLHRLTCRRDAIVAGFLGGALAIIPGILFFLSTLAFYPQIVREAVPSVYILNRIGSPWIQLLFEVALFGTFVKTGVGLLHAINERLAAAFAAEDRQMPKMLRGAVAAGILIVALYLAERIGIIELIAKGYRALTYVFIGIYVIPILTAGLWHIIGSKPRAAIQ